MANRRYYQLLALIATCLALAACSPTIRKPRLLHPGPAPFQRNTAEYFDPYPLPDMGPEIVGGRPQGFIVPRNEVEQARQFNPTPRRVLPPTVVTPPVIVAPPTPLY